MSREMTIKQALEEGYTHCGQIRDEWQILTKIDELNPVDFEEGEWHVAEKEGRVYSYPKEQIAETLADIISTNESEESGRDDDDIYNAIMEIDFSSTQKLLDDVLKKFPHYFLTDIKLTPELLNTR